jgi:hypothetical protein
MVDYQKEQQEKEINPQRKLNNREILNKPSYSK